MVPPRRRAGQFNRHCKFEGNGRLTRVLCRVWREGIALRGMKQRQQASKRGGNGFTRRRARGGAAGFEGGGHE
jgi:hypothetical protein